MAMIYVVCWALSGHPWQCSKPLDDRYDAIGVFEAKVSIGERAALRNVANRQDALRLAIAMMGQRAE
jgi:hypothetical protein